jgi:hypothetical protein
MTMPWPRNADSLVFATTNVAANWLALELADLGVALRQPPYAFCEARQAGMTVASKSVSRETEACHGELRAFPLSM